jgi:hypothetical protein
VTTGAGSPLPGCQETKGQVWRYASRLDQERKTMRIVVLLASVLLVAACQRDVRVSSSTTDNVTVRYFEGQSGAAEATARDECSRYGKRARLRNTTGEGTGERMAIYECII